MPSRVALGPSPSRSSERPVERVPVADLAFQRSRIDAEPFASNQDDEDAFNEALSRILLGEPA